MTTEEAVLINRYFGDFKAFALDCFDVSSTVDFESKTINVVEPHELVVAHIIWRLIFAHDQHIIVTAPTTILAYYWRQMVADYLSTLPPFLATEIKVRANDIALDNGNGVIFRRCSQNLGRGMTVTALYIIEPDLIEISTYREFMRSIIPTMWAGTENRQIITYKRDI